LRGVSPFWVGLVAAAGNEQDGNDDQPDPVVVKQIAQTVVHIRSSVIKLTGKDGSALLLSSYADADER
jgi:hypothetical protein